ncbi:MAG: hypothetical protein HQL56_13310 [Magnetococcales bacterium]|nr:hypothetical protein [Magnetococcales bacterium]
MADRRCMIAGLMMGVWLAGPAVAEESPPEEKSAPSAEKPAKGKERSGKEDSRKEAPKLQTRTVEVYDRFERQYTVKGPQVIFNAKKNGYLCVTELQRVHSLAAKLDSYQLRADCAVQGGLGEVKSAFDSGGTELAAKSVDRGKVDGWVNELVTVTLRETYLREAAKQGEFAVKIKGALQSVILTLPVNHVSAFLNDAEKVLKEAQAAMAPKSDSRGVQ